MNGAFVFTDCLRSAADSVWQECLNHPFVRGLGDGSLPLEKFRHFMLQDYLYLYEYTRVFALGAAKAREHDLMQEFIRHADTILNSEMNIHRAYLHRLGISENEIASAAPALDNLSYTNYMVCTAYAGDSAEITAAILACSWSYAEIGRKLEGIPGAAEHPLYGEWVRGYASDAYRAGNEELISLMNRLADGAGAKKRKRLEDIFVNCSRYELGFWNMAWELRQ